MRALILATFLLMSATAHAEPYVFAGIGSESSGAFGFGYQVTKHFGAEVSYRTAKEDGRPADPATVGPAGDPGAPDVRVKGYGLALVGAIPLPSNFAAVGSVGVYHMKVDGRPGDFATVGAATPAPGTPSATETVLGYALGASYTFASTPFAVRAMFEHTESKHRVPSTDVVSVQALYRF